MKEKAFKTENENGQNVTEPDKMSQILVIEEDVGMLALLCDVLGALGHRVTAFSNPFEAMQWLGSDEAKEVNAVLCDMRPLRTNEQELKNLGVPIIHLAVFDTGNSSLEAQRRGATATLTRPFKISDVKNLIAKAISGEKPE